MLKDISWMNYGIFILITLCVYYATIGFLYYLDEIKQLLSGKSTLFLRLSSSKKISANNTLTGQALSGDDLQSIVKQYMDQIKTALKHAGENRLIKQEIIYSLQQVTNKYAVIKNSPYKSFITNYIFIECANHCSIHLDEDDLSTIWVE
jgi:hypothetical protein